MLSHLWLRVLVNLSLANNMKISKPTKIFLSVASFLIGGILVSKLTSSLYLNSREFPIDHNKLFDGIEQIPIMVIGFIGGGIVFIFLCLFILRIVFRHSR